MVGPVYAKSGLMAEQNIFTGEKLTKPGKFKRRGLLEIGAAVHATAGIAPERRPLAQDSLDRNTSDPRPDNPTLDAENPDSTGPPGTDSKSLIPLFKHPSSFANERV